MKGPLNPSLMFLSMKQIYETLSQDNFGQEAASSAATPASSTYLYWILAMAVVLTLITAAVKICNEQQYCPFLTNFLIAVASILADSLIYCVGSPRASTEDLNSFLYARKVSKRARLDLNQYGFVPWDNFYHFKIISFY